MTGAGMMDCKRALTEANGDMEKAVDVLRKSGAAKAEKKSGRATKEEFRFRFPYFNREYSVFAVIIDCITALIRNQQLILVVVRF